jgi:tetratricopeptide (TPR) repeat protein
MIHSNSHIIRNSSFILAAMLLLGISATDTQASTFPQTDEEFARLPPYCTARLRKNQNPAAYKQWESRLTVNCFVHIHHYCAALNDVEKAMRAATKKDRDHHLMDSMAGGFDYMWNQAGASCSLMPEVFVNKGKALIMLEKKPEAAASFQKAIELNQRYIPAYAALADLYKQAGQTAAARQLLNYALKIEPNNRSLTRRLAELDTQHK